MGITAAIFIGGAIGGAMLADAMKPPTPPKMPDAPKLDEAGTVKAGKDAAGQQRKRAAAAAAEGSTILTGAQGLGGLAADQKGTKNLLGY
jgi:hypothetical protein